MTPPRQRLLAVLVAALLCSSAAAESPLLVDMDVDARAITHFRIGSDEVRFGPFEFVGGLSMASGSRQFGAFSGFEYLEPGKTFMGVADTGFWYFGTMERDADGRPSGVSSFRMMPMVDADGNVVSDKQAVDAEGVTVRNGVATASFERGHRLAEFALDPDDMKAAARELDFVVPRHELRQNRGLETVAHAPPDGPLAGARVVVAEMSIDENGDLFAAIIEGPRKGVFKVARSGEFDVTDGAFLPDGDLLLLERRFSMTAGIAMRLRRIAADAIRPGALVDGPVLYEADMAYQIDNMEGLDAWTRDDGAVVISIVSDDNHSFLQRNLYLEFVLHEE